MVQMMSRRRFAGLAGAAALASLGAFAAGCSSYPSVQEALSGILPKPKLSAGSLVQDGVLTVGVNTSNPPYCWPTSSGDELQGIDVDIALALGEQLGLVVKFVNVAATYNGAAAGTCDVVMGVFPSNVPGSEVLVGNYAESAPAIFARNVVSVVSDADLAAASVGVQADSASARKVEQIAPGAQLTNFSTLNDAFSALEAGGVQYVACDSFMGGYLATAYPDISLAGAFALPETRGVAVAATKPNVQTALTSAFDALTVSGELKAARTRWVGDLASITTTNQVALTASSTLAGPPAAPEGVGDETLGYYNDAGEWVWY